MRVIKTQTAITPRYSDAESSGMDIYIDTSVEIDIQTGQTYMAPTGLRFEIQTNCVGVVYLQNSLFKTGLPIDGGVRTINPGDRGE